MTGMFQNTVPGPRHNVPIICDGGNPVYMALFCHRDIALVGQFGISVCGVA